MKIGIYACSRLPRQPLCNYVYFVYFPGEFGDVYKGEIKLPGQPATKVAIKTLKVHISLENFASTKFDIDRT